MYESDAFEVLKKCSHSRDKERGGIMVEILPPPSPAAHAVGVSRSPGSRLSQMLHSSLFTIKVFSSEPQKGQLPLIVPFLILLGP